MELASFLAFFLLSHLPLLHSADKLGNLSKPTCPPFFHCNDLGPFTFPFTDIANPQCGLCKLNCTKHGVQKIQFGEEGPWYDVIEWSEPDKIKIHDPVFQNLFYHQSCDTFKNLTFPNSPSISFTISSNLTLFKCPKSTKNLSDQQGPYDRSYKNCPDFNLYYAYPPDDNSPPANLPVNCSVIQPPVLPPEQNPNSRELFTLLTANFTLELHVNEDCLNCHLTGGQCLYDNQEFQCAYPKQGIKRKVRLILGTVISAVGVSILIIIVVCFRKKLESMVWRKKSKKFNNVETFLKNYGSLAPERYRYLDVKKMTNSFKVKLGEGGYGCVYRGMLSNGKLVAIKVLNESKGNGEEFINEVASISRTSHVNIVTLLGFCFEGRKRALIYEFMPNGSLEKFIYDRSCLTNRQLGWQKLYEVAIGIARGLEYLHRGCNTRILHFDVKPHNILLDEDFCPKISDFGLARLCPRKESIISMLTARGTIGYIAPEVFCRNFGGVSHKSDVYSYGMMVLEMVGGRKNIEVTVDSSSEIYFPHWIYKQLELDEILGLRGITNDAESESARKMVIVSLWCIQNDPSNRPSMTKVVEMLEGSLESLQIPPKPFFSSPSRSPGNSSTVEIS